MAADLNAKGCAVPSWPKAWGGCDWLPIQHTIFQEEQAAAPAPPALAFNVNMIGPVLIAFGTEQQKGRFLPRVANLDDWWCQGFSEPGSGSDLASLLTFAERFQRREYRLQDGSLAAELAFADVLVPNEDVLDVSGRGFDVIERAYQAGIAALAAEAVGAMAAALDLTVEHLKMRRQFNVPIATFQALQHRAAEMLLWLEQARSMALFGMITLVGEDIDQRWPILATMKVQIGRSARFIGQSAIQLHGGIGMASEYPVGHYFRRLTAIELLLGDADHHLATLVDAGGLLCAAG